MKNKQSFNDLKYYSACCRCQYYTHNNCVNKNDCVWLDIEKDLKALEIIKKKLPPLMRSALLDYCNKEEYDLLKEVLL